MDGGAILPNRSKAKGTAFESLVRDYLKDEWSSDVDRLTLSGASDRGDLGGFRVGDRLVAVECKNHTAMSLASWVGEAQREAENYRAVAGIVIHKRKGKGRAADQYVTLTLRDFLDILRTAKDTNAPV